jgi:hypothetical protein
MIKVLENEKADLKYNSSSLKTNNLIKFCYKLDENETPKYYRLLDVHSILPDFTVSV